MSTEKPESARGRKSAPKAAAKRRPAVTVPVAPAGPAARVLPRDKREQAIRQAAYALYEARGRVSGHELENWLEAEAQVQRALEDSPADAASGQTAH